MTVEEDVYTVLEVQVRTDNQSSNVTLNQGGLTKKLMTIVGMLGCNKKTNLVSTMTSGTDADILTFDEAWDYASVLGVFIYLSRNSRPEIQF